MPPTIYRRRAPLGPGSLQFYVEHDPHHHFFNFTAEEKQRLRPVVVFDLISNNADRKGGHILIDEEQHIWLIDQGLCFHVDDKLRTVVWDFAGETMPKELLAHLDGLVRSLEQGKSLSGGARAPSAPRRSFDAALASPPLDRNGLLPDPPASRRPYPWPPV